VRTILFLNIETDGCPSFFFRSGAKRLLLGLDEYTVLDFNFKNVDEVGQGFCDEIFRVYANRNPGKILSYHGASDVVRYMIERSRMTQVPLLS
jgi:hypothetical protein